MLTYQIPSLNILPPDWWYQLISFFDDIFSWVVNNWPSLVGISVFVLLAGIIVKIII